jgi:hypothetical protein
LPGRCTNRLALKTTLANAKLDSLEQIPWCAVRYKSSSGSGGALPPCPAKQVHVQTCLSSHARSFGRGLGGVHQISCRMNHQRARHDYWVMPPTKLSNLFFKRYHQCKLRPPSSYESSPSNIPHQDALLW